MDFGVGESADTPEKSHPVRSRGAGPHRKRRRVEPYSWLAAGAVGVGIAAALTGAGAAYADTTAGDSAASSNESTRSGPAKSEGPSSDPTDKDNAGDGDTGDDDTEEVADDTEEVTDDDNEEVADDDTEEVADDTDDTDEADDTVAVSPRESDPVGDDEESTARESTATKASAPADADLDTVEFSTASGVLETAVDQPPAARPQNPLTALFVRLQTTFFNRTPTAKPVQTPGQSSQGVVTGTVGADDRDGDPLVVELATGPRWGSVQVNADGTYTYTPSDGLAAGGGIDTFDVIVRETNADTHMHGLADLWRNFLRRLTGAAVISGSGGSIVQTVTVTVAPIADNGGGQRPDPESGVGLSDPFLLPDAPSGRTLNIRDYGATSNKSSDNDATAIQNAINAAEAGDTVYIPDGTYHIKSTINLKSGVSLIGQSREKTVLAGAFTTSPHAMIYAAPGTANLTLSTFKITLASGRTYKAAVRLGLEGGNDVSRIAVRNLFIEKFERFGVQLQNAYQVLVDGNIIKNATALNGGGQGYGIIIDQSRSNNNWIRDNEIGPVIRHAILVQKSAHNNLIELNRITGTVSSAIDLHGEDEYANEIRYNTISDGVRNGTTASPNGAGIEVGEYSGVIGSTTEHDNSGPANWIHHNVIYNYSLGVRVVNDSNYTRIEDNVIYGNSGAGIQADLAPLNNLYISGNEIYGNGSGIVVYDVTRLVVQNNIIRDNKDYGLWLNAGTTGYTVTGNTVTNCRVDVILGSPDGVYLVSSA